MNKKILLWPAAALLGLSSLSAQAVPSGPPVSLFEYDINVDGVPYYITWGDPVPANVDVSLFDDITGLGTITASFSGAGSHSFDAYFDHDIGAMYNDNELGSVTGAAAPGQSFEIDDPAADIFTNFEASTLDNLNNALLETDVAMAMGWDFVLAANEIADIIVEITEVMPTTGLVLGQHNGSTVKDIWLSGELIVTCTANCGQGPGDDTGKVPEPSMLLLMSLGLAGVVATRRRKKV